MKMFYRFLFGALCFLSFTAISEPLTFSLNRLQDGQAVKVTEKSFPDKYLFIAVGYTGCPDICPTTMMEMRSLLQSLDETPALAKRIQPLFITIDPVSDTLKDITDYPAFFDSRIIGLRADDFPSLDKVVETLHASYGYTFKGKPVLPPDLPKGYTVMHSIYMYLYSPEGELLDVYPYNSDITKLVQSVKGYLSAPQGQDKTAEQSKVQPANTDTKATNRGESPVSESRKTEKTEDAEKTEKAAPKEKSAVSHDNEKLKTTDKSAKLTTKPSRANDKQANELTKAKKSCLPPKPFRLLAPQQAEKFLKKSALHLTQDKKQVTPHLTNLWAVWCAPCRKELPYLQQLAKSGKTDVSLVNIEDSPQEAKKVLNDLKVTLETDYVKMELLDELGIQGLPVSIVTQQQSVYLGVGALKDEEKISGWLSCLAHDSHP